MIKGAFGIKVQVYINFIPSGIKHLLVKLTTVKLKTENHKTHTHTHARTHARTHTRAQ